MSKTTVKSRRIIERLFVDALTKMTPAARKKADEEKAERLAELSANSKSAQRIDAIRNQIRRNK